MGIVFPPVKNNHSFQSATVTAHSNFKSKIRKRSIPWSKNLLKKKSTITTSERLRIGVHILTSRFSWQLKLSWEMVEKMICLKLIFRIVVAQNSNENNSLRLTLNLNKEFQYFVTQIIGQPEFCFKTCFKSIHRFSNNPKNLRLGFLPCKSLQRQFEPSAAVW
jgi:hypothetical protein